MKVRTAVGEPSSANGWRWDPAFAGDDNFWPGINSLINRTVFWKRGDLDFAAVSDMDRNELERFVQLVRVEE